MPSLCGTQSILNRDLRPNGIFYNLDNNAFNIYHGQRKAIFQIPNDSNKEITNKPFINLNQSEPDTVIRLPNGVSVCSEAIRFASTIKC